MSHNRYSSLHQTTEVNTLPMPNLDDRELAPRVQKGAVPQDIIEKFHRIKQLHTCVTPSGHYPFSVTQMCLDEVLHWIWVCEYPTTGDCFGICQLKGDALGPRYVFIALLSGDWYMNCESFLWTSRNPSEFIRNAMDVDLYNHQFKTTQPSIIWLK